MVERSPEKAGVGGSIPSLATIISKDLGDFTVDKERSLLRGISRAH